VQEVKGGDGEDDERVEKINSRYTEVFIRRVVGRASEQGCQVLGQEVVRLSSVGVVVSGRVASL
jgi:hypothetical protein